MTTDTPNNSTQPENTQPDGDQPGDKPGDQPDSAAPRAATPRTWLSRIARRKRMLAHEQWRRLDDIAREGISDEDYATTMATLESMARNLGWDESEAPDESRSRDGHHGRGRGHGHGHGHGRGHKGHHGHHGHRHHGRCAERATVEA